MPFLHLEVSRGNVGNKEMVNGLIWRNVKVDRMGESRSTVSDLSVIEPYNKGLQSKQPLPKFCTKYALSATTPHQDDEGYSRWCRR